MYQAMIWYARPGAELGWKNESVRLDKLTETHVYLCDVPVEGREEAGLDEVWYKMQGEAWSPLGEARSLIMSKGLAHTSMSVGDVVYLNGSYYAVMETGWKRLERLIPISDEAREEMLWVAAGWRYLVAVASLAWSARETVIFGRFIEKAQLDRFLMIRFGLMEYEARDVSNRSAELRDFTASAEVVRWVADDRPAPWTWQYPELAFLSLR